MTLWLVIKDMYGPNLVNDFGHKVTHTSEVVAAFEDELAAEHYRDDMVNGSEYEIYPTEEENVEHDVVYIDGIVETVEVNHGESNEDAR